MDNKLPAQAQEQEEEDGEATLEVVAGRMIRAGYSYDGEAGIWWNDTNKPGIVRQLEAEQAQLRQERDEALSKYQAACDSRRIEREGYEELAARITARAEAAEAELKELKDKLK